MNHIKETEQAERSSAMNVAYDNASNDLVQSNEIIVQRRPVSFNLTSHLSLTQIQKKDHPDSEKKGDILPGLGDHMIDAGGSDDDGKSLNGTYQSPPFQMKTGSGGATIQRDEAEKKEEEEKDDSPKVKGGKITVLDDNKFLDYSGTYDEIVKQLSGKTEAGSIKPVMPPQINFVENADKKTVSAAFTVTIVKTMPRWTEYASIKASISTEKDEKEKDYKTRIIAAWDKVYASLNGHEEEHKKDERKIYTELTAKLQGESQTKAGTLIDAAAAEGKTKSDEYHTKKESEITKWPIVEKELKKVE